MDLDDLFGIAHADALERMKIEEDKMFVHRQREPSSPGCLAGVDKKIAEKEERSRPLHLPKVEDEKRKKAAFTSSTSLELSHQELDVSFLSSDEESLPETSNVNVATDTSRKRSRKDFVSPKLVAALDRCQLSIRDSVYIIQATVEVLGFSTDEHPIKRPRGHSCPLSKTCDRTKANTSIHPDLYCTRSEGVNVAHLHCRAVAALLPAIWSLN